MCIIKIGVRFPVLIVYCIPLLSNMDKNKQLKTVFKEAA